MEGKVVVPSDLTQKRNDRLKVMICTDGPYLTTGYGQVAKYMADAINEEHEVHFLSLQHFGMPIWYVGMTSGLPRKPYRIYPRQEEYYGFDILAKHLKTVKPDVLITLCDPGLQIGYIPALREAKFEGQWIAYMPFDTEWMSPNFAPALEAPDIVVTMSKFAEKIFKASTTNRVEYIPHGVDTNIYCPLPKKEELKEKIKSKFVVGAVGRNQTRKMWPQTLRGFAEFINYGGIRKTPQEAALLLHTEIIPQTTDEGGKGSTSLYSSDAGWSIVDLLKKYGIWEHFRSTIGNLTVLNRYFVQPNLMNEFYNMMDVFGFLTGGEGFGLPSLEAQAAGAVLVTTDYTTGKELTGHLTDNPHGFLIKPEYLWTSYIGIEWAVANHFEFAEKLQYLYDNPAELEKRSQQAVQFAKTYDWRKVVCPKWMDLLRRL